MVVPRVRVLDLLVPGAVRVVQEHEADGDGSDDEEDGVQELEAPRRVFVDERCRLLLLLRCRALRRRDVDVDAAGKGQ